MFARIFEAKTRAEDRDEYLSHAATPTLALQPIDGFIANLRDDGMFARTEALWYVPS